MTTANIQITQLHVMGESYDPSAHPNGVCAFDSAIVFSAEATNSGDRNTGAFSARFVIDGHEAHNEQVHDLSPGASQWVQWRHNPLHEGEHSIYIAFDPTDRVHESDEADNTYTYPFHVEAGHASCHTVTMEAETVTGHVDPHGAAQHGWHQIDVSFVIKDPKGAPIRGYRFFSQFFGQEGQETEGGQHVSDSAMNAAGILTRPNVWLQNEGTVRLMGVADMDGGGTPGPVLEGVARYHLANGATSLGFDVQQGSEVVTVTASNQHEASEKVTAEGHAGIQIEILELGGSVGTEHGTTHTEGRQLQYQVTLGTSALNLTQH